MAEKIGQGLDWLEVLKLLSPNWGSTEQKGTPLTPEEMSAMRARNPGLVFLPESGKADSVENLLTELQLAAMDEEEENFEALKQRAEKQGPQLLQKIKDGKPRFDVFEGLKDIPDPYHFKVNGEEPDLFTGLPEPDSRGLFEKLADLFGGKEGISDAAADTYGLLKALGKDVKITGKKVVNALNPLAEIPRIESEALTRGPLGTKEKATEFLKNLALDVGAGTEAAANAGVDFLDKAGNKLGQWVFELTHKKDLQKLRESQAQKMQDALEAFGPEAETVSSEKKGPKSTPGKKPEAEAESGYDWGALLTAIGSGIGNWAFDPRTGSLVRTDSNGPSIFDILKTKEDVRASKQKSQQPTALGGSAYYDPRTGEVVQTESDILKVARLQAQLAQDEEKRKNTALAAQLLAELEPRERMKLMSEAMLAGKDKLDTNAYIIQRIQNAQNAKRK